MRNQKYQQRKIAREMRRAYKLFGEELKGTSPKEARMYMQDLGDYHPDYIW